MSDASEFAKLRTLPVAAAIDYMRTRADLTVTHNWQDLWQDEHARQFTVSRLTRMDLLQAVHDGITRSVQGDLSRKDWMRDTGNLLAQAGWWGEKQILDPATGERVKTTFDPARLALIFDTNTRQAYAAGQWQRLQAAKHALPYLRYVTRDDGRVRAQHRAWHNVVLPVDDEFWKAHYPPNGWRCRCRVVALTQQDYDRGYSESRPGAEIDQGKHPITKKETQTGKRAPIVREPFKKERPTEVQIEHINRRTGEVTLGPRGIDPGFAYNAGEARERVLQQMADAKLQAAAKTLADAARRAGMEAPTIAREIPDQDNWKTLGRADLRAIEPMANAPELLPMGQSLEEAISTLRGALGVPIGAARSVQTPVGPVTILEELLAHVVEKRPDGRERYAQFVLPTLMSPDEVWSTAYDDGTRRRRFIKLFATAKYDIMVVVRQEPNGDVLWNIINRNRKDMNSLRVGALEYAVGP